MSELMKKYIEGYQSSTPVEKTQEDYWQEVMRAYQNKMVKQTVLEGMEEHLGMPCGVVFVGDVKGLIPLVEFDFTTTGAINTLEEFSNATKEAINKSTSIIRSMIGQTVAYMINEVDRKNNLFIASRKNARAFMRKKTFKYMEIGGRVPSVIRNVNPYRAILDIGGVTAYLKASDYQHGWTDDLSEYLKVGDNLEVEILSFNENKSRAEVSRKALYEDPWLNLDLKERSEYRAEVVGIRSNGVFYRIKTKSGFIDGFMRHPKHDILEPGTQFLVRILNISPEKKNIFGLYIRES